MNKCTNCEHTAKEAGWFLKDYYGITGYFCRRCYNLVSHDSFKQPEHPAEYLMILLKQTGKSHVHA